MLCINYTTNCSVPYIKGYFLNSRNLFGRILLLLKPFYCLFLSGVRSGHWTKQSMLIRQSVAVYSYYVRVYHQKLHFRVFALFIDQQTKNKFRLVFKIKHSHRLTTSKYIVQVEFVTVLTIILS